MIEGYPMNCQPTPEEVFEIEEREIRRTALSFPEYAARCEEARRRLGLKR